MVITNKDRTSSLSNLFKTDTQDKKSTSPQNEIFQTIISQQQNQTQTLNSNNSNFTEEQIDLLSHLPFWINDPTEHRNICVQSNYKCCFNHYIGLPEKYGDRQPLFDFQVHERHKGQEGLFHAFENHNAIYVLKATGIGFSELAIRYMCWKAFTGQPSQYRNSHMIIVTGPNVELATKQITRIRDMFRDRLGVEFSSEKTKITLPVNNVKIQAYPSHNVASFRGLPKVSIVFIDEADFFPIGQQVAVRDASERYLGKSNAKIILGSTPYSIGGLMETIQKEENSIYTKLFINYEIGLNKIFSQEDIAKAKTSPSFEREYNLRYAYDIGNVLTHNALQKCLDIKYNPEYVMYECPKCIGIDPGFGSSKFAIVVTQFMDSRIQVLYAQEFDRPEHEEMQQLILDLARRYGLYDGQKQNGQIIIDGANVSMTKGLKHMLNEYPHYDEEKPEDQKFKRVRPINFGTTHRTLLSNMVELVSKGYVAIDPKFEDLLNQLRVAQMDANLTLIKKPLTLDLIDAFRLALYGFQIV